MLQRLISLLFSHLQGQKHQEKTALADAVSSEKLLLWLFQMLGLWLLVTVKVTEEGLKI